MIGSLLSLPFFQVKIKTLELKRESEMKVKVREYVTIEKQFHYAQSNNVHKQYDFNFILNGTFLVL